MNGAIFVQISQVIKTTLCLRTDNVQLSFVNSYLIQGIQSGQSKPFDVDIVDKGSQSANLPIHGAL